jgi:hypothetical protein
MDPRPLICAAAALALLGAAPAASQGDCMISLARLPKTVPQFQDFPAAHDFHRPEVARLLAARPGLRAIGNARATGFARSQ